MDMQELLQKPELLFVRRIAVKPKVNVAAR
jgi:hypothetical protein